jgi:Carboxypeptidase regulatory-like domain/Photosynthesis system II assembly factor YCF48/Putative zinc-finger
VQIPSSENDFRKMDPLTKLVSGRLKAHPAPGPHPAPDLLSAFAENVLPEADRGRLLQHLGACSDCREILFLALPELEEAQKVLIPKPSRFRRWGLTWGAAVATVAIAAVFFTTRRLEQKNLRAKMVAPASATRSEAAADFQTETGSENTGAENKKLAAETPPPELDRMQAAREASAGKKIAAAQENEAKPQPEAKHMTGKMQAPLVFDQSGEVHVQSPAQSARAGPVASQSSPSALRAEAGDAPSPAAPAPGSNATSSLEGVIVDRSGAVVSNAKVTTVGPAGAKIATSNSEGRFSFDHLPPGFYSIKAEARNFKATEISQVAVLDNNPADIRVTLDVGVDIDVIEVTGAAPAVESSTAFAAEPQPPAQFGMQKAAAARAEGQGVGGAVGSGAGVATLGWTLSPNGAVQRSSDGGKTWQPVSIANAAGFRALSAVGANIWVGGKAGALYHSPDSGQTWGRVEPAVGSKKLDHDIVRVDFSDALAGTVNTVNGEVWSTSDGGQTWVFDKASQVAH